MLTVHRLLLEAKMKIESPLDVKRMSLNLVALSIAWDWNLNFSFILKCMLLFAGFFPFQFLTKTNETELSRAFNCKTTCFQVSGSLGLWVSGSLVAGSLGFWVSGSLGLWVFWHLGFWASRFLGLWVFKWGLWVSGFLGLWFSDSLGLQVSEYVVLWVFRFQGLCNTRCEQRLFKNCKNCNNEVFFNFSLSVKVWKNLLEGEQVM